MPAIRIHRYSCFAFDRTKSRSDVLIGTGDVGSVEGATSAVNERLILKVQSTGIPCGIAKGLDLSSFSSEHESNPLQTR